MSVIKRVVQNEDGTYDAHWSLTSDQMAWLLTYAITELVSKGEIDVEIFSQKQLELDFLSTTETQGNA